MIIIKFDCFVALIFFVELTDYLIELDLINKDSITSSIESGQYCRIKVDYFIELNRMNRRISDTLN